jgi:sterol carrier protein 2
VQTGVAAVVVVSKAFLDSHPYLEGSAIEIAGQALTTDSPLLFETRSALELIGVDMARRACAQAYREAGVTIGDISVIELHDCFSTNEMCTLEALGLAMPGEAWKLVRNRLITYQDAPEELKGPRRWLVNPSGGLISKGHPLGATGLAQCTELGSSVPRSLLRIASHYGLLIFRTVSMASTWLGSLSSCACDKGCAIT